jgi:RNA polymerase sigma-70 factor (ECF subfamily)
MDSNAFALTADQLLEHERFVRSIARGLLRDEHAARDAVQDTWMRALLRGPRSVADVRAWLRRVTQNRARDLVRQETRRTAREQAVARREALEPVETTYERLAVQREVVSAILALEEPYRTVVILRYYHDLEPTEIARQLEAKPSTVRTQLVRAHDLLRGRLDRRYHGRQAWAGLLLPLGIGEQAQRSALALTCAAALTAALGGAALLGWPEARTWDRASYLADPAAALAEAEAASPMESELLIERIARAAAFQEPAPAPIAELLDPRAELSMQGTYEHAAFSFEYGAAAKTSRKKVRNDWDLVFERDDLRACTVTDDDSLIVDLGALTLVELCQAPLEPLRRVVKEAATLRYAEAEERPRPFERQPIERGHSYFVWTLDTDTDLASLCAVVEHLPGARCVLDWYATEDGRLARGSLSSPRGDRTLASVALALRTAASAEYDRIHHLHDLLEPRVVLQARVGAIGGNPCRIDFASRARNYFRRISTTPLDLSTPVATQDTPVAYREGGTIPKGMKFVVTNVTWTGVARGDNNGHGKFRVQLGEFELVDVRPSDQPIAGSWKGRVELVSGDEANAYLEVSNSSMGEVVFTGTFEKIGG